MLKDNFMVGLEDTFMVGLERSITSDVVTIQVLKRNYLFSAVLAWNYFTCLSQSSEENLYLLLKL